MKKIALALSALAAGAALALPPVAVNLPPPGSTSKETCFNKSESVDGLNKTCVYDCPSGEASITIKSTSLCPLQIDRK